MIRVSTSSYPIINEIVSQFDQAHYPEFVIEPAAPEEKKAYQELDLNTSERNFKLPEALQVMTYDLAPNIWHWILSTGILRKEPKDNETWKALEESAANRLKSLNVARIPYISSTERLIQHIFNSAIARALPVDKLRIRSAVIATSKREVIIEHLLRALIKIENIFIRASLFLALCSAVFIIGFGFWVLFDMGLTILAALAAYGILYKVLHILWLIFGIVVFAVMRTQPQFITAPIVRVFDKAWGLTDRLIERQRAELDQRQTRKAPELWANLLLGSKA
jgi:hypothetical protein